MKQYSFRSPFSIFACFIFVSFFSSCRFEVNRTLYTHSIRQSLSDRVKGQTLVVLLPDSEASYLKDYQQLVPKAWTFSPVVVAKYTEAEKYLSDPRYAELVIRDYHYRREKENYTVRLEYYYLTIASPNGKVDRHSGRLKTDDIGHIELSPDPKTVPDFGFIKNIEHNLYTKANFRNFQLPYLLAYLRRLQDNLEHNLSTAYDQRINDHESMGRLNRDTLYIPEGTVFSHTVFRGVEEEDIASLFKSYPAPYKILPTDQLINLVKSHNNKKPLYLFEYIRNTNGKSISVLDLTTGSVFYRRNYSMSGKVKAKDIEALLK